MLAWLTGCHHGTVGGTQTATAPLPQGSNDLSQPQCPHLTSGLL